MRRALLLSILLLARSAGADEVPNFGGGWNAVDPAVPLHVAAERATEHSGSDNASFTSPFDGQWWDGFALPTIGGTIKAMLPFEGELVVAGTFVQVGTTPAQYVASWDGAQWHAMGDGLRAEGTALTLYGGQVVAGLGSFTSIERASVCRWNGSTWDTLGATNGPIQALTVHRGELYAAGQFSSINGVAAAKIARWDGSAWHAVGAGFVDVNGIVNALVVHDTLLVAAGTLPTYKGVAAWNGANWVQLGAGLQDGAGTAFVYALASNGTTLWASGSISTSGATVVNRISAWNGATWSGVPGANDDAHAIVVHGGSIFSSIRNPTGGGARAARFDGTAWQVENSQILAPYAFAVEGSTIWCGGSASAQGTGPYGTGFQRYDAGTWSPVQQAWAPGMAGVNSYLYRALEMDGALYVSGAQHSLGAQDHFVISRTVSKWNGVAWEVMPGLTGPLGFDLAAWQNSIVVAGDRYVSRWTGSGWIQLGGNFEGWVYSVTPYQNDLIAVGIAHSVGGVPINGVVRWNGATWSTLGAGFPVNEGAEPQVALEWGPDLVVGGYFDLAGGDSARNLAVWDGTEWHELGGGANGGIVALAVDGPDLLVGGGFSEIGGQSITGIARWNGTTWTPIGDNAEYVVGIRVHGGRLFAVGEFVDSDGSDIYGAAVWSGSRWLPLGSGIIPSNFSYVRDLEFLGDDLFMVGGFVWANGHGSRNIARLPGAALLAVEPSTPAVGVLALSAAPNPTPGSSQLRFTLSSAGRARLAVRDIAGREVTMLADRQFEAGPHVLAWSASVAPGIYFATLEVAGVKRTARIVRLE